MSKNYTEELFPYKTDILWEGDNGEHNGWNVLSDYFKDKEGRELANNLKEKYYPHHEIIFPAQKDIFRAFKLTPFKEVKVVILGQDPYPDERAEGLCFSQKINSNKNDSLKHIFSALKIDDKNRQLDGWAKQGVLLLNTILTVNASRPGSHKNIGWERFTMSVIKSILENRKKINKNDRILFILFGNYAKKIFNKSIEEMIKNDDKWSEQKIKENIISNNGKKHHYKVYVLSNTVNQQEFCIFESPHPASPLFYSFVKELGSPFECDKKYFDFDSGINWKIH